MEDSVLSSGKREKMTEDDESVDRISELPDEVIHSILSLVPARYAIRCSVLSKRWKDRWTFIHNLDIEANHDIMMTASSIDKCIKNHKAKDIHKFRLAFFVETNVKKRIKKWINFAIRKNVQELIVHVTRLNGDGPSHFNVPQSLISYNPLQLLDLSMCNFTLPPNFSGFPSLKTFRLQYTNITEQTLLTLLSTCPLLENFYMMQCRNIEVLKLCMPNLCLKDIQVYPSRSPPTTKIEIDAPCLQTLRCCGDVESFCLMTAPSVVSVSLAPYVTKKEDPHKVIRDWASSIENISNCEDLTTSSQLLLFLFADYTVNGRSSPIIFRNLKTFEMLSPIAATYDASALVRFFGCCPSLEMIELNVGDERIQDTEWLSEFMEAERVQPIEEEAIMLPNSANELHRLDRLKTVKVMYFSGKLKEMKVLSYLIQKAVNLEELILTWSYRGYTHNRPAIIAELHQIASRFSSQVKITAKDIFGGDGFD